jgi:hypothetical protein
VFVVCDAANGGPKAILHENRYLTDLRTGAAGAVAVKHLAAKRAKSVAFIGTGVIAEAMARATATVFDFEEAFAYSPSPKKSSTFCKKMSEELGFPHYACATAEDAVRAADVVFTQTPGGEWVLEEEWLRPHALDRLQRQRPAHEERDPARDPRRRQGRDGHHRAVRARGRGAQRHRSRRDDLPRTCTPSSGRSSPARRLAAKATSASCAT